MSEDKSDPKNIDDSNPVSNLHLWNKVCATDPARTKKGTKSGYSFTSVNPQYNLERATKLWGPCGDSWSIQHKGEVIGVTPEEKIWVEEVTINYPSSRTLVSGPQQIPLLGTVSHYGVARLCYKTQSGYLKIDEEAPKKALTNGISKALSMLGFSADLWLGYYDSPEYIGNLKEEINQQRRASSDEGIMARLKMILEQSGAKSTKDEELLCRFWSGGEVGVAEAFDDPDVARKLNSAQSAMVSGEHPGGKVVAADHLKAAVKFSKANDKE